MSTSSQNENWTTIRPNRNWFRLNFTELLNYRDLLYLLVRRDFVSRYKQTILGPLWFFIQPLVSSLIFTVFINQVAGLSTSGVPAFLFQLSGQILWGYFTAIMGATSSTFNRNANIYSKVYFPRLIVPLASATSALFSLFIQLATLAAFYIYFVSSDPTFSSKINASTLLFPLLVIQVAILSLGFGFWFSSFTAKYRDLQMALNFLIQLWMWATPVVYPLATVRDKLGPTWEWILTINPMTMPIECFREILFGTGTVDVGKVTLSACISLLLFFSGIFAFNRTERKFVDTV